MPLNKEIKWNTNMNVCLFMLYMILYLRFCYIFKYLWKNENFIGLLYAVRAQTMCYRCQVWGDKSAAQRRLIKQSQGRWKGPLLLNLMIQNLVATTFNLNFDNFLPDSYSVFVELSYTFQSCLCNYEIYLFATCRNHVKLYTNRLLSRFFIENLVCFSIVLGFAYVPKIKIKKRYIS